MKESEEIKPKKEVVKISEDENNRLNYFQTAPLRSADKLLKKLYPDDKFYEETTYARVAPEDAKKLFLYGVCHEVMKICISMMGDIEFLQEKPKEKEKDGLGKMIYGMMLDSQAQRIRKMIELLSLLILFRHKNSRDEEYRIYLSAENLDIKLSRQKEFKDFFDREIVSNVQYSIDSFIENINVDLKTLGQKDIWFLDPNKLKQQEPSVFMSKRKIYLNALEVASDDERLMLGITYSKSYSRFSSSVHPIIGSHNYGDENNHELVMKSVFQLSMLCMHIMHTAYKIAGIDDPEGIDKVMGNNFEKSTASESIAYMKRSYDLGDLVVTVYGDLAEIVDKKVSKRFGYTAYKVKYLSQAPLPQHTEDWLESMLIRYKLLQRSTIRPFYEKLVSDMKDPEIQKVMELVFDQPDEKLLEYCKSTFLELHKLGLLIPMIFNANTGKLKDTVKED